jgi:hypothetical protein
LLTIAAYTASYLGNHRIIGSSEQHFFFGMKSSSTKSGADADNWF